MKEANQYMGVKNSIPPNYFINAARTFGTNMVLLSTTYTKFSSNHIKNHLNFSNFQFFNIDIWEIDNFPKNNSSIKLKAKEQKSNQVSKRTSTEIVISLPNVPLGTPLTVNDFPNKSSINKKIVIRQP